VNMWDENGRAYMASIPTEDAVRIATYIHGILRRVRGRESPL